MVSLTLLFSVVVLVVDRDISLSIDLAILLMITPIQIGEAPAIDIILLAGQGIRIIVMLVHFLYLALQLALEVV